MEALGAVLAVLGWLANTYTDSQERKSVEEYNKKQLAQDAETLDLQKGYKSREEARARRTALGNAIHSRAPLNMPIESPDYPDPMDPYKKPEWMDTTRGLVDAAQLFGGALNSPSGSSSIGSSSGSSSYGNDMNLNYTGKRNSNPYA